MSSTFDEFGGPEFENPWHSIEPIIDTYEHEHPVDPFHIAIGSIAVMTELNKGATSKSESYRGFTVVASGLAYDSENNRTGIITAGNYRSRLRPDEQRELLNLDVDIPKFCGEMAVVETAREEGFTRLIAMVVSATPRRRKIYDVTQRDTKTLHPCDECRRVLPKSSIVDDDTFVVTTTFGDTIRQVQTMGEIIERYKVPVSKFKDANSSPYSVLEWNERQLSYDNSVLKLPGVASYTDISRDHVRIDLARQALTLPRHLL